MSPLIPLAVMLSDEGPGPELEETLRRLESNLPGWAKWKLTDDFVSRSATAWRFTMAGPANSLSPAIARQRDRLTLNLEPVRVTEATAHRHGLEPHSPNQRLSGRDPTLTGDLTAKKTAKWMDNRGRVQTYTETPCLRLNFRGR